MTCPKIQMTLRPRTPIKLTLKIGVPGKNGEESRGFEVVSKNLKSYPSTLGYDQAGKLSTITYTTPTGPVVKTFLYTSGKLTSIVLSGAGLPTGIATVKTLTYSGNRLTGLTYS